MDKSKYTAYDVDYSRIEKIQADWDWGDHKLDMEPRFSLRGDFQGWLQTALFGLASWYGRRISGPFRIFGFLVLFNEEDVIDALRDDERFKVPFGREMNSLAGPPVFGLGDDDIEHERQHQIMRRVILSGDPERLAQIAGEIAEALLDDARGEIDVADDLITPVLAECCRIWYGLKREDPHAFVAWNNAISTLIFGTPTGASEAQLRRAFEGSRRMRASVGYQLGNAHLIPRDSVLGRLVYERDHGKPLDDGTSCRDFLTDERIISMVIGMVSGSAPTTQIGAAYSLNRILKRPDFVQMVHSIARQEDAEAEMLAVVRECMRLRPSTWPGVFRKVDLSGGKDQMFNGLRLRHGESVVVAVASALRDSKVWRSPHAFKPERMRIEPGNRWPDPDPSLAFGYGSHYCVGRAAAEQMTTAIALALFRRKNLRRTGRMRNRGTFPGQLPVQFDDPTPAGGQEMIVCAVPISFETASDDLVRKLTSERWEHHRTTVGRAPGWFAQRTIARAARHDAEEAAATEAFEKTRDALAELDTNPACGDLKDALDASNRVHTCSMSVVWLTRRKKKRPYLMMEFNVDGPLQDAIDCLDTHAGAILKPVLKAVGKGDRTLGEVIAEFRLPLRQSIFGHTGVGFNGVPEWSVQQIQSELDLAIRAEEILETYEEINRNKRRERGGAATAAQEIRHGKAELRDANQSGEAQVEPDPDPCPDRSPALVDLERVREEIEQEDKFRPLLFRPRGRRPAFAAHEPITFADAIRKWSRSPSVVRWVAIIIAAFVVVAGLGVHALGVDGLFWQIVVGIGLWISAVAAAAIPVAAAIWLGLWLFKRMEARDTSDDRYAPLDHFLESTGPENAPGLVQNHITAVNHLKPGFLRRIALAVGVWIIARQVEFWFRPGFVLELNTIRHARWLKVKGTNELIFQANFDGSWERYLEDFSDHVAKGQTMVWSNCEGFPRTTGWIGDGAWDSERFKRWVRGRQVRTNVWYSRFGNISNDRIRRNALIRDGLARAITRSEAEAWIRLFGSSPRVRPDVLEVDEIPSIVFTGFGKRPFSHMWVLKITDTDGFRRLLRDLHSGDTPEWDGRKTGVAAAFGTFWRDEIPSPCTIGFTASGLARLGMPVEPEAAGHRRLRDFPTSFALGMGRRARTLGDDLHDQDAPDWIDHPADAQEASVDAVIMLHSMTERSRDRDVKALTEQLRRVAEIETQVQSQLPDQEQAEKYQEEGTHDGPRKKGKRPRPRRRGRFGFRDGFAQPTLRGAPRVPLDDPDAIAPGEFILGYKDEREIVGPSPEVAAGWDQCDDLPDAKARTEREWPDFAEESAVARDFGRNGTFLVIRQLELDNDAFESTSMEATFRGGRREDEASDLSWVAEKVIGRRRSGQPIDLVVPSSGLLEKWNSRHPKRLRRQAEDMDLEDQANDPMGEADDDWDELQSDPNRAALGGTTDAPRRLHFAERDPYGVRTPLGSHVRRSNPRDSLDGGGEVAPGRNRHRILRRGREYEDRKGKGLLFACLNASIERQFEFVQQSWINSTSFHGLWNESDPFLSPERDRRFSIPTPNGRVVLKLRNPFVRFRGGGYFFVPGRAALRALTRDRK